MRGNPASGNPPRCVFVAGPLGSGKTRWLQERIRELRGSQPDLRCAVILAEEGKTRMERFVRETPAVAVRRLFLPCPCCPALALLPETVQQLVGETHADWLFVEVSATATVGLLGEFDRQLGWPRELVVCLDEKWLRLSRVADAPPFIAALVERATTLVPVVHPPPTAPAPPPKGIVKVDLS